MTASMDAGSMATGNAPGGRVLATAAGSGLTDALRPQLTLLADDIRSRVLTDPEMTATWRARHAGAVRVERTAAAWSDWLTGQVTQAAVGWLLGAVFVRFCEDNTLLGGYPGSARDGVWITSPDRQRRQMALDAERAFYLADSSRSYRHWLRAAFDGLAVSTATAELVGEHAATALAEPSADAVGALLAFWRRTDDNGDLVWSFADPELSTRFLGDLYQDLSDHAKSTYALLQTPEFVEEFILDQTLTPALKDRPLAGFRLIDPTCGSGHFLLGAFRRLFEKWGRQDPDLDLRERVKRSMESVHGVDLNPFAAAIARFRLLIEAAKTMKEPWLTSTADIEIKVANGDSLLNSVSHYVAEDGEIVDIEHFVDPFPTEDKKLLRRLLLPGSYDVVIGNPPYIVARDRTLNARYRELYKSCKGTYALTVPFMERFFQLAKRGDDANGGAGAGWVGQITANSFMKREFGSKLIEDFLVWKDLRLIVDSSGAYIPGHGTPTVILVGRNDARRSSTVRAVLGIRGEPGRPPVAAQGKVWSSIAEHHDEIGYEDEWLSVVSMPRQALAVHPWSLSGGAAPVLGVLIGSAENKMASLIAPPIGRSVRAGADEAFMRPASGARWRDNPRLRVLVQGENVRDWSAAISGKIYYPYDYGTRIDSDFEPVELWKSKPVLAARKTFQGVMADASLSWWAYMQHTASAYSTPLSITFAEISTHNHFVLDRGGKVFKQTSPIIKLCAGSGEDDHLRLLGILNSSTALYWLKQNSHNKGNGGVGGGIGDELWEPRYQFTGTTLQDFPLPAGDALTRTRRLDALAQRLTSLRPAAVIERCGADREALQQAAFEHESTRRQMVAEQEELDWQVYGLYGLPGGDLVYGDDDKVPPEIALGERVFEIALARRVRDTGESTAWFERHRSTPITEMPSHWPADYQDVVQRRLDLISSDRFVELLERPEYKRRWQGQPYGVQLTAALRDHLLDRLEQRWIWFDSDDRPRPRSVNQLADLAETHPDLAGFRDALDQWAGRRDVPVAATLVTLIDAEHVPYLAALRYKPAGLLKRADWEAVWAEQRREDAGTRPVDADPIPVPPKYTGADFVKASYWSHRGKLDVPKERFISYPGGNRPSDSSLLLGWAGWDHAQQGLALAIVYAERSAEAFDAEQLVPLLAGIEEQLPWIRQWHPGEDPVVHVDLGDYLDGQLDVWAADVGRARPDLAGWRAPAPQRGRRRVGGAT